MDLDVCNEEVTSGNDCLSKDSIVEESLFNLFFLKFVSFSEFLGLPVEGYEEEIVSLLSKLEAKKDRRVAATLSKKRRSASMSLLDKELHKLECSIDYSQSIGKKRNWKSGWDRVS